MATVETIHQDRGGFFAASFMFFYKIIDGVLKFSQGHLNQVMNKSWQHRFYQLPIIAGDSGDRFTIRPG